MNYSFLQNLTIIDNGRLRLPKERNPKGMAVRVYANGDVYPSEELTKKYDLEFINKDSTERSNGIDVVDSIEWAPFASHPRMILFGITPKKEAKVDLFATCKFNEDGTPKSSVLTQGAASEVLLNLTRSLGYLDSQQKYVDLVLLEQYPINTKDGLAFIPKTVERGERKGEKTYERREGVTFYPVTTSEEFEKINGKTQEEVNTNETVSIN